jgi:hypothetical protein
MIIKEFNIFINENYNFVNYMNQIMNNNYTPLSDDVWDNLQMDGYPDEVNDYEGDYNIKNYSYTKLNITDEDKNGLINFDEDIIEKWNDFDIELKDKYYPNYIDFIDYDNGIIYIIKYK